MVGYITHYLTFITLMSKVPVNNYQFSQFCIYHMLKTKHCILTVWRDLLITP